ncbi:FG-GAP-like repeat-containing protein [Luteimonas sp. MC1572]|uniref:FG-GAP repeat domain-containing protein n=1 Tax=Luteimonas sp. MC1572 TaxID=2799325 RepID=UPI0018F05D6B|nr:FG-GAP-like repeat-containing protein [Luteimonas sp. MC1572]MBJ6980907.1 VCBS repeat-containing protein [Luteimonas sp. MC1572]QQO02263.1 VCBS repeat-containing protein [Luteimonas sp. MC1572]
MHKLIAVAMVLACACAPAVAEHGFEPIAAIAPDALGAWSVAVGDVTGDGLDDVLVLAAGTSYFRNRVVLYAQAASGFAPPVAIEYHPDPLSTQANARYMAVADLDADGDLDILVSHYETRMLTVLRNDGGAFSRESFPTTKSFGRMEFTDFNGDGHLDLVGDDGHGSIGVLPGLGGARFGEATWLGITSSPSTFQLADVGGDGRLDLVYQSQGVVQARINDGTGFSATPRTLLTTQHTASIAAADFTGDGRADIAIALNWWPRHTMVLHPQDRHGRYRSREPLGGGRGTIASMRGHDLDGDGRQDLLMLTQSLDRAVVTRLARPNGGFAPPVLHEVGVVWDFALGDVNGDGIQDLVLLGSYGGVAFMAGRSTVAGSDLAIALELDAAAGAVRVDNLGTGPSGSYDVTFHLQARLGSVHATAVPDGCWPPEEDGALEVTCRLPSIAAGAHHLMEFPFRIRTTSQRNFLIGTARIDRFAADLRPANNVAVKRISLPAPGSP